MTQHFNTIGLFGKYKDRRAVDDSSVKDAINGLTEYLRSRGLTVRFTDTTVDQNSRGILSDDGHHNIDLGIVIGGDGTMLHVARTIAPRDIPVVGVNMGRLGFLTDIPLAEMYESVGEILDGQYKTETRIMLEVEVWLDDQCVLQERAFNDVVLGKGNSERLVDMQLYIDGEFVMESRTDGFIVSTPTGSTAYNLSAGGPILHPQVNALVLVPICPHTLSMRPIVLKDSATVDLTQVNASREDTHVSIDGQIKRHLDGREKVRVQRSAHAVRLLRPRGNNVYVALRSKLGWGDRP